MRDMLKDAGLDGFFTNHSLRRTAAMRLFRAGQNVKLIKEVTGHVSNAVEKYEMTSDQQCMDISSILQAEPIEKIKDQSDQEFDKNSTINVELNEVGEKSNSNMIANVIESTVKSIGNRKAWLTLHIDLIE